MLHALRLRSVLIELDLVSLVLSVAHRALDILLSLLWRRTPKQHVDLFERHLLGLWDEEEDEDSVRKTEDAKHDEGFPPDVVDGFRRDFRDDEVEEPLCGCGEADTVSTCRMSVWCSI